jgi:hypothetical protein
VFVVEVRAAMEWVMTKLGPMDFGG